MNQPKIRFAQRDQVETHVACLDDLVPHDHRVREIWAYVEQMDLSSLLAAIRSRRGEAGAPAFDPRTLMCLWLYATVEGVGSARRLSRLCEENLVYRWITGGEEINYHTLSSFRVDCGAVLEDLLVASVATLAQEGFLNLESMDVAVDGVRVRAWAGRSSMHRRPTLRRSLDQARQYVESLKEAETPPDAAVSARKNSAGQRAARERVERLERAMEIMQKQEARAVRSERQGKKPREPRVSTTDPEAGMLRMANGGTDPAHNIQFCVETTARVVTHVHVPLISSDTGTLSELVEAHARLYPHRPAHVLADQGFFKYHDIAAVERQGCALLMPDLYANAKNRRIPKQDREEIARWKERLDTPAARNLYKLRSSTVEWVNARARAQGLQQIPLRGQLKARIIGLWHGLTHNISRTIALRALHPVEQTA